MTTRRQALPVGLLCITALLSACGDKTQDSKPVDLSAEGISTQAASVDAHVRSQAGASRGLPVRGSISAEFDGQQRQWDITTLDDSTKFSAGTVAKDFVSGGNSVNLWGQAASRESGVMLEMTFAANAFNAGANAIRVNATVIPHGGMMPPHWTAIDDPQVSLVHAEYDGQSGRIEGRFSGSLCYRAELYSAPDPANCKPIEGRFASDLARDPDEM